MTEIYVVEEGYDYEGGIALAGFQELNDALDFMTKDGKFKKAEKLGDMWYSREKGKTSLMYRACTRIPFN